MNISDKVYDVIYIGNYTKDTITSPAGVKYVDGGAVNYAAHAANALGFRVAVVTRLSQDDDRVVERLRQTGIDCYPTYTRSSTLMHLDYPTLNPDMRELTVADTAGTITVEEITEYKARTAVVGTSFRGEVNMDVVRALRGSGMTVGVDMQGFARVLRDQKLCYEAWPGLADACAEIDILKTDAVEAYHLTGESDIYRAAAVFAEMSVKEVVLTHKDGLLVLVDGQKFEAGFFPASMEGRSGRGDTCLGSYAALRMRMPPSDACLWAAAVTSLKMERMGPFNRTIAEVEQFIESRYRSKLMAG
ncbi:MAG: PfkB family carbohydrate kinase [Anaerolineaceae bacterium]